MKINYGSSMKIESAHQEQLNDHEHSINDLLVTQQTFNEVKKVVEEHQLQKANRAYVDYLERLVKEESATKEEVKQLSYKLENYIDLVRKEILMTNHQFRESDSKVSTKTQDMQSKLSSLQKQSFDQQQQLTRLIEQTNDSKQIINTLSNDQSIFSTIYAKKSDLEKLRKRIDDFSNIENIDELRNVMLPKVKHFTEQLEVLIKSNEEVKECIIKFD